MWVGDRVVELCDGVSEGEDGAEAFEIKNTEIVAELSLPPVKIHCSVLAEDAIKAAVADWRGQAEDAVPAKKNAA